MGTFADLITTFNKTVVKALGALFMSGAVVGFLYGLARFIWGLREGDTKTISNGRQFMIWSITALFVMFSVYGIIRFFQGLVPGLNQNTITIPEINYGGSSRTNGSPIGNGGTDGSNGTNGSPVGGGGVDGSNGTNGSPIGSGDTSSGQSTLKNVGEQCTFDYNCSSNYCQTGPYGSQCAVNSGNNGVGGAN
jgi:hypothetical protein